MLLKRFLLKPALCLAASLVFTSPSAFGQEDGAAPNPTAIKKAAKAFDSAKEAYNSEDYRTAARQFEQADEYAASPIALMWAIDAHDQAGQLARAATLAALGKARHPDNEELMNVADGVLERAETQLHVVRIECSEPCTIVVDDKLVHGRPALQRSLYLQEGNYQIAASFVGDKVSDPETITAIPGGEIAVQLSPAVVVQEYKSLEGMEDPFEDPDPVEAPPEDAPPKEASGWSPAIFWIGTGATALGIGITAWSGIDTQNNPGPEKVRDTCRNGSPEECRSLYNEGIRRQNRTNIFLGATTGVALLTAVVAIWLTDWGGGDSETETQEVLTVKPWALVGVLSAGELGLPAEQPLFAAPSGSFAGLPSTPVSGQSSMSEAAMLGATVRF